MPRRAPHICACGNRVPSGSRCRCTVKRDAERKARFDKTRPSSSQRGYGRSWEKARKAFLRRNPRCAFCGNRADLVDHKTPHKGDQRLFWIRTTGSPSAPPVIPAPNNGSSAVS